MFKQRFWVKSHPDYFKANLYQLICNISQAAGPMVLIKILKIEEKKS